MATDHIPFAGGEQIVHSPARQGSFVIAREDLTITHARYAAGEHVAGRHVHHQHTDAFYILEGEVIFEIGPEVDLRDGIQVEWDIAPVPADGGLSVDRGIISRPPRGM
jgi:mannose-6-phosphate isomerase-like protein (cupin superfamily)